MVEEKLRKLGFIFPLVFVHTTVSFVEPLQCARRSALFVLYGAFTPSNQGFPTGDNQLSMLATAQLQGESFAA